MHGLELFLTHANQSLNKFVLPWKSIYVNTKYQMMIELGFSKQELNNYCKSNVLNHTHYALEEAYYYLKMKELQKRTGKS